MIGIQMVWYGYKNIEMFNNQLILSVLALKSMFLAPPRALGEMIFVVCVYELLWQVFTALESSWQLLTALNSF